jgi:hypothetical protein
MLLGVKNANTGPTPSIFLHRTAIRILIGGKYVGFYAQSFTGLMNKLKKMGRCVLFDYCLLLTAF